LHKHSESRLGRGQHYPKCTNTIILCIDGNVNNFPDACVCDVASTHFCFQLNGTAVFANVRPQHANSNLHRLDGTNVLQPSLLNTRAGAARVVKQIATDSAHKLSDMRILIYTGWMASTYFNQCLFNTRVGAARDVNRIATDSAHKLSARGHNGTVGCHPVSSTSTNHRCREG